MSPEESRNIYFEVEQSFREAMRSYGVADAFIDRVMQTSSDDMIMVSHEQWETQFTGRFPWYEEYMKAKCGSESPTDRAYLEEKTAEMTRGDITWEQYERDPRGSEIRRRSYEITKCIQTERLVNQALKLRNYSDLWEYFTDGLVEKEMSPEEIAQWRGTGKFPERKNLIERFLDGLQ